MVYFILAAFGRALGIWLFYKTGLAAHFCRRLFKRIAAILREGTFIKKRKHFWTNRIFVTAMIIVFQLALLLFIIWFLSEYFLYFYGFCIVLSIVVTIYIINKPGNPSIKLAWIIPILLFPVFGGLLYLAFGRSKVQEPLKSRIREAIQVSQRILVQDDAVLQQLKQADPLAYRQSCYITRHSLFPLHRQTTTTYLTPGEEKFKALLEKLKQAKHFIFLEYFIVHEGKMWNAVLEILQQKVKEGVEVRMMYDDVGCINTLPEKYYEILQKMGIKAQVFNPLQPALDVRLQNRDHRKIAVIDGVVGFTGGINLADEYINEIVRFGHWKDASIMIEGMGVWNLTVMFLQMWNYSQDKSEDFFPYHPAHYLKVPPTDDGFVQPFGDSPLDHETVGENVYMQIINCAKNYVYITTPYLVVDNEMITALTLAAKSGVDVRIITPHIEDKWYVHLVTQANYQQLVEAGVKIYEYTPGFIHSKTFVSDDVVGVVGTTNMDFRSFYHHFECGVWMYGSSALADVKRDFLQTQALSQQITLEWIQSVGLIRRLIRSLLRVFSPLI